MLQIAKMTLMDVKGAIGKGEDEIKRLNLVICENNGDFKL
jgi:hypothetical protein